MQVIKNDYLILRPNHDITSNSTTNNTRFSIVPSKDNTAPTPNNTDP